MTPLPILLRETMSDFGMSAVDHWWSELSEPARSDVIELWETASRDQPCVARVTARYVEADERDDAPWLWHSDFYEYLVNHEVYLLEEPAVHICTQQPAARAATATGLIPASFACPLASDDCLMQGLLRLASGKSVRLQLVFLPATAARGAVASSGD